MQHSFLRDLVSSNQGPQIEQALKEHGVTHVFRVYENAPHACGTGTGTDAEGWLDEAVAFWEEQTSR